MRLCDRPHRVLQQLKEPEAPTRHVRPIAEALPQLMRLM